MDKTIGNIRTMEFLDKDDWDRPVYKCVENGVLWKDIALGENDNPELYSCGNEFDGEPSSPIKTGLVVVYKSKYKENPYRFNYMLLSRSKSDCDNHLTAFTPSCKIKEDNIKPIIEKMKELYNSFPEGEKPEWLTYDAILNYEKLMVIE
jgi:hypothetical protein